MTLRQAITVAMLSASLSTGIALYATADAATKCVSMTAGYVAAINAAPMNSAMPGSEK